MSVLRFGLISVLVVCAGCSRNDTYADVNAPAVPKAVVRNSSDGPQTVTGTVRTAGEFPSIVIFEPEGEPDRSPQPEPPVMDQVQQTFTPPVLLVRTGQPVEFHNDDDVLHNVRVHNDATRNGAFNVAIPTGDKYVYTFKEDGYYDVGCDIHPAMAAQIIATASPYNTLADAQGHFVIEGMPTGPYKVTVYAGDSRVEKTLTISRGQGPLDLRQ